MNEFKRFPYNETANITITILVNIIISIFSALSVCRTEFAEVDRYQRDYLRLHLPTLEFGERGEREVFIERQKDEENDCREKGK